MNTDFNSTAMLNLDHYLNGTVNSATSPQQLSNQPVRGTGPSQNEEE
jgi:hypothetical protein